jgi:Ca2+/Na+ antiporter
MKLIEKYIYIYIIGLGVLFLIPILLIYFNINEIWSPDLPVIWLFTAPFIFLLHFFIRKYRKQGETVEPLENQITSKPETSATANSEYSGGAVFVLVVSFVSLVPGLSFFLSVPILFICFVTFFYFFIKKDKKNTRLSAISLLISVIGLTILFSILSHGF